ncbi:hypothetical protein QQP08_005827 [Theobroma cacao]|nr:hypothetical protein QQP08_005827 [Theobroma cacao]
MAGPVQRLGGEKWKESRGHALWEGRVCNQKWQKKLGCRFYSFDSAVPRRYGLASNQSNRSIYRVVPVCEASSAPFLLHSL